MKCKYFLFFLSSFFLLPCSLPLSPTSFLTPTCLLLLLFSSIIMMRVFSTIDTKFLFSVTLCALLCINYKWRSTLLTKLRNKQTLRKTNWRNQRQTHKGLLCIPEQDNVCVGEKIGLLRLERPLNFNLSEIRSVMAPWLLEDCFGVKTLRHRAGCWIMLSFPVTVTDIPEILLLELECECMKRPKLYL